jgi:hypothetical protein
MKVHGKITSRRVSYIVFFFIDVSEFRNLCDSSHKLVCGRS